jgi:uncharacterized membrane protein
MLILLVSWLLLFALRRKSIAVWVGYTLGLTVGLYTSDLLALVICSHAVYVLLNYAGRRRCLLAFFSSIAASAVFYTPWVLVIIRHRSLIAAQVGWGATGYPVRLFAEKWLFNASAQFFDLAWLNLKFAAVGAAILLLCLYALWRLVRETERPQWTFVVSLLVVTAVAFAGRDIVEHAHWSTTARYLIPTWLGLQLAVAFIFGQRVPGTAIRTQSGRAWAIGFVALLICEGSASWANTHANSWYNDELNVATPALAAAINNAENPLIVGEHSWAFYLDIARYLKPKVHVQLFAESRGARITPRPRETIFVLSPSPLFQRELEKQGFSLRPVSVDVANSSAYDQFHASLTRTKKTAKSEPTLSASVSNYPDRLFVLERTQ